MEILKDANLTRIGKGVKPDSKKRVTLPNSLVREGVTYYIYSNNIGQIVLDPQVSISASELWLFKDKDALAAIDKGMLESLGGKLKKRGSFKKYI